MNLEIVEADEKKLLRLVNGSSVKDVVWTEAREKALRNAIQKEADIAEIEAKLSEAATLINAMYPPQRVPFGAKQRAQKMEKASSFAEAYKRYVAGQKNSWYSSLSGKIASMSDEDRRAEAKQKEADEKAQAELKAREESLKKTAHTDAAIAYLIREGKVFGEDFTTATAVGIANDVAYEKALVEAVKLAGNSPVEFIDWNCNDWRDSDDPMCSGWDGTSPRCDCGHRRVSWVRGYYHSFLNPSVVAEAH